jgi:glycosyltransferase involved in cell wall biosynthesis
VKATVAMFLPSLVGGGAERVMVHVAGGLAQHFHVDLVLARKEGPLLAEVPGGVRLVALGASRTATAVVPLARYLRRQRPEAMMSALTHANLVALFAVRLARATMPLVVTEHSHPSENIAHATRRRDRLTPALMRRLYPWATAVTGVSNGVAENLVQRIGVPGDLVTVVRNPVVADDLMRRARQPLDHSWFAAGQPPVLLAVGRLTAPKDLPCLLQALALVRREREVRAVILGEGEDRPTLERMVRELSLEGAVQLPGFVDNPYPFFRQAALFVLSSRWEGLPTVLLEALALGLPIVSTDCPSGPREILENGRLGILVPVGEAEALAAAILAALHQQRRPYDPRVLRPYELTAVVSEYARLLQVSI